VDPGRALAYDPATDHFWVANFSSDIYEIDRSGAIINQYPNSLSIYGLAWDAEDGYLWAWSQNTDKDHRCLATQIDPLTGNHTGVEFEHYLGGGELNDIAGGASITDNFTAYPDNVCLVTMHQADSDTIVVYDIKPPCFVWVVTLFVDPFPVYAQEPATFSSFVLTDCLGALTYEWDFGDGNISFEEMPTHVYENQGLYYVCLTVTSENFQTDTFCGWLEVGPPMDLFIFDDEGRADVEVTTSTGRYRVNVHMDGWQESYEGFGNFGPCPFPEEYDDIAEWACLYSGPFDPWFFKMGMDLTHKIYLGHLIIGNSFVEIHHHP